jgi:hypothetical protein
MVLGSASVGLLGFSLIPSTILAHELNINATEQMQKIFNNNFFMEINFEFL